MTSRILVVDDKLEMAKMISDALADRGYEAVPTASGKEAVEALSSEPFDAVITDLRMPGVDGMQVLATSRSLAPERPVIVMTAFSAVDTAVESIRRGAYHYVTKPFKLEELVLFLERALEERRLRNETRTLRTALRDQFSRGQLVIRSAAMQAVMDVVDRVAESSLPVLIQGETGTGKSVVARAIHGASTRAEGPFITVNCAALPEALLESELFGHVKGAFTGATMNRPGLFAEAKGGTLFLDEIGELALPLQVKLLDVIERRMVRPVGAEKEQPINARLIAATNRDLREAVRTGTFREDLLYRLDVVTLEIPALRNRREDIPVLIERFLEDARSRHPSSPVQRLAPEVIERLLEYDFPGNVRELAHIVERLVVLGRNPEVKATELPTLLPKRAAGGAEFQGEVLNMRELQRRYARWALQQCGGHKGRTAEKLGVDGKTLAKWLSESLDSSKPN